VHSTLDLYRKPRHRSLVEQLVHLHYAYDPPYGSFKMRKSEEVRRWKRSKLPVQEKLFALGAIGEVVQLAESQNECIIGRVARRRQGWEEFADAGRFSVGASDVNVP
jgi:hypothetical protein